MPHTNRPPFRIGQGTDLHRLELPADGGRPLIVGNVRIEHDKGPVGHSDGDVLLHALTDAVLGAMALPDIGELFPDHAPENEARDSAEFLLEALRGAREGGYRVMSADATVVLERPKLKPYKEAIRLRVAELLDVSPECVGVKAKTHERVDAVGQGLAIEAHAVVLLAAE